MGGDPVGIQRRIEGAWLRRQSADDSDRKGK
jgi:hypothetical protein